MLVCVGVKLYQGVADVVGGALDAVGSLPRNIPPLPNPFQGSNNDLGDSSIERVMEADNKTLTLDLMEQTPQFCRKDSVNQSLEEVLSNIDSVSEFLNIYENSNLGQQSDFNLESHTLLIPNNHALNKLSPETLERLSDDDEFAKQFVLRHTISGPICCFDIQRNSGPFFNSNRKMSLRRGTLITLRRSVSGTLYADKSEIERLHCNTVYDRGVVLTLTRVLGL